MTGWTMEVGRTLCLHTLAQSNSKEGLFSKGSFNQSPVTQEEAVRFLISALGNCRHVVLAGQRDDPPDGAAQPGPDGGPARARRQVGHPCFKLCCWLRAEAGQLTCTPVTMAQHTNCRALRHATLHQCKQAKATALFWLLLRLVPRR